MEMNDIDEHLDVSSPTKTQYAVMSVSENNTMMEERKLGYGDNTPNNMHSYNVNNFLIYFNYIYIDMI